MCEVLPDRGREAGVRAAGEDHHPADRLAIVVARHRPLLGIDIDEVGKEELVPEQARRAHGFDHRRAPSSRRAATRSA